MSRFFGVFLPHFWPVAVLSPLRIIEQLATRYKGHKNKLLNWCIGLLQERRVAADDCDACKLSVKFWRNYSR